MLQYDDGRVAPLDFNSLIGKVKEKSDALDGLNRTVREKYAPWEPLIENGATPDAVAEALSKLSAIDTKKLVDAGKVDEVVGERVKAATASMEKDLRSAIEQQQAAEQRVRRLLVSTQFGGSKFLKEKTTLTPDIAEARWGAQFKVEKNDSVVAYDEHGNVIYSRTHHGQPAGFDEALEQLVAGHPSRDSFLRGTGSTGSSAPGGASTNAGGGKVMSRAQFETLAPSERAAFVKDKGTLTD